MRIEDIPTLVEIEKEHNPFPWNSNHFADSLRAKHSCWTLKKDNEILGYAIQQLSKEEGELLNIAIHPNHRRKKYAQFLINHLFELAIQKQIKSIFLEVRESNKIAQSFYNKLGFHQIGTRKNYYPALNGREDALIFAREMDV